MKEPSAPFRWKQGMPKLDGLYWHRSSPENNKYLVWLETIHGRRIASFLDGDDDNTKPPAEWAGPIAVPEPER